MIRYFSLQIAIGKRKGVKMPKSFCTGCKLWEWISTFDSHFHACAKFLTDNLKERKEKCNGKYKEIEK